MRLFLSSQFREVKDKYAALNWGGKRVAFIPTAGDLYETAPWIDGDRQALVELGLAVEDYDIKSKTEEEIFAYLNSKDIIFVAGGNTFYLLYHARLSGFDEALAQLIEKKIYIGSSAGSVLAGPSIEPTGSMEKKEQAPQFDDYRGLHFVDFIVVPHADSPKYGPLGRQVKEEWKDKFEFIIIPDEQAVVIEGDKHWVI